MTPRQGQAVLSAAFLVAAVLIQVVVLARLPLPGAVPGLVLPVVVAIGMACGPTYGSVAGFSAGLAVDVLPPATGILGATALALVVAGDLAGRVRDPRGLAPVQRVAVVAGLAALAVGIQLSFGLLLGAAPAGSAIGVLLTELVTATLYTAVVGALVVPVVSAVLRRAGGNRRQRRARTVPG